MPEEEFDFTLIGDLIIKPSTQECDDPLKILANKGLILYIAASYCSRCQSFLKKLHLFYQLNNKVKEEFEIIFCSMDRNEDDYTSHIELMQPWWALPYAIDTLPKLVSTLKVEGNLPHLVVINKDGKIITKEGVEALEEDPTGNFFPWRPNRIVDMLPNNYVSFVDSQTFDIFETEDLDEKYILLYFASHSDALSQEFTPWLMKAYNILKKKRQDFELIFVSGDESEASYETFMCETSFCALPYHDSDARESLETRLEITSYPTLVMLGPRPEDENDNFGDRPIINSEVRAVIENGDYISDFPFYPKPWGDLSKTTDDINTHKCLIVFHEGGDDEQQMDVEYAVRDAAEEYRSDELVKFYWACDEDAPLCANIRNACNLGPVGDTPTMVFLDILDDGKYYVSNEKDITEDSILDFLGNYKLHTQGTI